MSIKNPRHYNEINEIYQTIWKNLAEGTNDRSSEFHTFTLATTFNNIASARTVVLRGCNKKDLTISFHTNNLSKKIEAIKKNSNVESLFYSRNEKIQIRVSGNAEIHNSDEICKEIWMNMSQDSRDCYLYDKHPGSIIENPDDIFLKKTNSLSENFCFVNIFISKIEWLYLSSSGHRRVSFSKKNSFEGNWVVP